MSLPTFKEYLTEIAIKGKAVKDNDRFSAEDDYERKQWIMYYELDSGKYEEVDIYDRLDEYLKNTLGVFDIDLDIYEIEIISQHKNTCKLKIEVKAYRKKYICNIFLEYNLENEELWQRPEIDYDKSTVSKI